MFKLVSVVVVVMAVFGIPVTTDVPPAGKCKNVTPAPIEFNTLKLKHRNWQVIYASDDEAFADVDSECREIFSTSPNFLTAFDRIKTKNNSEIRYAFKMIYGNDFEIYEEDTDENNKIFQFKWIPIAVRNKSALLYYRCSDNGILNVDTRYIVTPKGHKLSPVDKQQLLEEDKKLNLKGGMRKLENKYA